MTSTPHFTLNARFAIICLAIFVSFLFTACSQDSPSISDLDRSLTQQFRLQWEQKKDPMDKRSIKAVHIGRFYKPSGNDSYYADIEVLTEDNRIITGSPVVPLGESCVGVSFSMPDNGPYLNAILKLNR